MEGKEQPMAGTNNPQGNVNLGVYPVKIESGRRKQEDTWQRVRQLEGQDTDQQPGAIWPITVKREGRGNDEESWSLETGPQAMDSVYYIPQPGPSSAFMSAAVSNDDEDEDEDEDEDRDSILSLSDSSNAEDLDIDIDAYNNSDSADSNSTDIDSSAPESDEEGDQSDESNNYDDDDELFFQPVKRRNKGHSCEPGSDDDPDPPTDSNLVYPTDRFGWSRNRKTIHIHKFKGTTPEGPSVIRPENDSPLHYFLLFFPLVLFKKMARYTNFAARSHARFNKPTTTEEIRAWLGIRMLQGVHHNKSYMDDWSTHPGLRNPLIANTMVRERFNLIAEILACANPNKGPKSIKHPQQRWAYMMAQPMYPLQVVWDTVVANCLANWNPAKQLALDEATVLYKSTQTNVKRFYMPLKPKRMGFKIFTVCEAKSGYLLNMIVRPESGLKMKNVAVKIMEPFFFQYHELYLKHAYTSPALAAELLEKRTYICGAIKKISKGLPDDFSHRPLVNPRNYRKILEIKNAPRGTMYFRQQGKMTAVVWKDIKVLSLLSTCHQSYRDKSNDFIKRKVKDGDVTTKSKSSIQAPPQAVDHAKYSIGVNRHDQLRSYQSCSRQSMRWWRKLLYFLIDVSRVNAWLCYKEQTKNSASGKQLSHRMFVVDIATALIAGFAEGAPEHQHFSKPVPMVNGPKHQLIRLPSPYGKMCIQCRREGTKTPKGKPRSTRTGCISCNIHLCRGHCFLAFHAAEGVKIKSTDMIVSRSLSNDV